MNPLIHVISLTLGQGEPLSPWEGVRGAFQHTLPRTEGQASALSSALVFIAILLSILLLFLLAARIFRRGRSDQVKRPPHRFFAYIMARMGVGWTDRFWLLRAARHSELPQPAVMLLTPELFERHTRAYADALHMAFRGYVARRFTAVSAIAFPAENSGRI